MQRRMVCTYLDPPHAQELQRRAQANGRSVSAEVAFLVREYLSRTAAQVQDAHAAPVLDTIVRDRIGELETWLRPMVAATSIHAASAVLLALEVLCGTRIDPTKARETLDIMRGRAYRMLRKRDSGETGGLTPGPQ